MVAVSEASITITPEYNHAEKVGEHPFFIPGSSLTLTCVTSAAGASLNWTHTPNRGDTPQVVVQVRQGPRFLLQNGSINRLIDWLIALTNINEGGGYYGDENQIVSMID